MRIYACLMTKIETLTVGISVILILDLASVFVNIKRIKYQGRTHTFRPLPCTEREVKKNIR
jgi:hypothetical protein